MAILMTKQGAVDWARRLVEQNPGNLNDPTDLLENHLPCTYDLALETAKSIKSNYPAVFQNYVGVSPETIALAGGLHDLGRTLGNPKKEGQEFHEIKGYWVIRTDGLERGVSDTQGEVDSVAKLMLPHGSVYETFTDSNYEEKRKNYLEDNREYTNKFGAMTPQMLLPDNLGQLIVDFAELSNLKGNRVGYRERLEEAIGRYKAKEDPRADCIIRGSERRIASADIVSSLLIKELSKEQAYYLCHLLETNLPHKKI